VYTSVSRHIAIPHSTGDKCGISRKCIIIGTSHVRNAAILLWYMKLKCTRLGENFLHTVSCECDIILEG